MIDTNQRADRYDGNGSTTLPYPITFPFLKDAANIQVQIVPPTGSPFKLTSGQFTVHDAEGPNPYVTTATAYGGTYEVIPFRWVQFTQPFEFPNGSALNSVNIERAIDRAVMIAMQTGDMALDDADPTITAPPEGLRDVPTWADAAARASVKPQRVGQLGVQRSDASIWISDSTDVGDWSQFAPNLAVTPPVYPKRLFLGFASDTGYTGVNQNTLAGAFADWRTEALAAGAEFWGMLGGDNRYGGTGQMETETAVFNSLLSENRLMVIPGNHDIDGSGGYAEYLAKFGFQSPTGASYWTKIIGNGLVQVWGLDWGRNTARTFMGPTYATQRAWLAASMAASTAVWKIGIIHCPPVSTLPGANMDHADTALDWPEFAGLHALLSGHGHYSEYSLFRGLPLVNSSSAVAPLQPTKWVPQGALARQTVSLFADSSRRLAVRCIVSPEDFIVQYVDMFNRSIRYQRSLNDKTLPCDEWHDTLLDDPESLATGTHRGALPLMRAMQVTEVRVGVTESSNVDTEIAVWKDGTEFTSLTLPAGHYTATVACDETVGQGARVSCRVVAAASGYGVQAKGLRVGFLGRWVS